MATCIGLGVVEVAVSHRCGCLVETFHVVNELDVGPYMLRPAVASCASNAFALTTAWKCSRRRVCIASLSCFTTGSTEPSSIALSAAGIAGPRSVPQV